MTYFKIISDADREVVGVEAIEDPAYVRWQEKHHRLVYCDGDAGEGILSPKDNDTVYRIEGKELNGVEIHLTAVFISAEEYDELAALLDDGERIPAGGDSPAAPNSGGVDQPMTVSEMRQIILEQQNQINMLTDCILEMSEVVYGDS